MINLNVYVFKTLTAICQEIRAVIDSKFCIDIIIGKYQKGMQQKPLELQYII